VSFVASLDVEACHFDTTTYICSALFVRPWRRCRACQRCQKSFQVCVYLCVCRPYASVIPPVLMKLSPLHIPTSTPWSVPESQIARQRRACYQIGGRKRKHHCRVRRARPGNARSTHSHCRRFNARRRFLLHWPRMRGMARWDVPSHHPGRFGSLQPWYVRPMSIGKFATPLYAYYGTFTLSLRPSTSAGRTHRPEKAIRRAMSASLMCASFCASFHRSGHARYCTWTSSSVGER
jgi:hypothetical protein